MCSEKRCFLVYIIFSFLIFLAFIIVAGFEDFDQENFSVWIQAKALRIEISAAALLKNDEIGKYLEQISLSIQYLRELKIWMVLKLLNSQSSSSRVIWGVRGGFVHNCERRSHFDKMTKLKKKDKNGVKIKTAMAKIRMAKAKEIQKRKFSYTEYCVSHEICPQLCCLFDETDFCERCTVFTLSANTAEFHNNE
jgi:hypothetical protein